MDHTIDLLENLMTGFFAVLLVVFPREVIKAYLVVLAGDETPRKLKRTSLNPFVHMDPIGTIAFILFDFGWARPVPVFPMKNKKIRKVLIFSSLIGPILGGGLFLAYGLIARTSFSHDIIFKVFYKACKWSLTYAIFSLFPVPPLDGSKILGAFLPDEYWDWYIKYEIYGILFLLGILLLWILPLIMQPFVYFIDSLTNLIILGKGG
ncbi:peptidase M50 [Thermosipho melanesiensis]|uniref:Peptidase M50 n=2 Tax=Thermosipho melanesiensis TaxID=46541 RepID=A6LMR5_THEM4|nr:site-2 protease family protein [Thermosipho melanesiensis]ABR31216.1 peptidase M50 [Thermosipho melanesiensis BI429]APT74300.1 peptidase M50 [Thermosipho melanesiensis]OOC36241.1 peptidase M50 [Thermosipho melanesiensis]OOC37059.1 peptidase M50 [Thermosipho melanesiensis]OOC37811.1 peptidase M50 [Thermosipho melanesiensis]